MNPNELAELLRQKIIITGDGNVIGKDNTVTIIEQIAGDYAIQIGQLSLTLSLTQLRRLLNPIDLEKAEAQLDTMPLDTIPPITNLPHGSRMPFGPYRYFVGREPELRQLAMILKAEHGGAAIGQLVATTGLGGIGKTQLAVEFAHRYGPYFAGGLFWLDFSNAAGISNEVARCGGYEGMELSDEFENFPLPKQVGLVKKAWEEPLPRLLIFDNCEDEALVARWRPKTGGCRVLITSRRGEWSPAQAIQQVKLDTLTPKESRKLLRCLAPHLTRAECHQVAEELGHFPLALHLAGSFLHRYREVVSVPDYLNELTQKRLNHPSLVGSHSYSPTRHEQHVARTFAISWQRLDEQEAIDRLAQQLLLHVAQLAPGVPVPSDLLQLTLPEKPDDYTYIDAQYRLVELGLLDKENSVLTIHRLVAAFTHTQAQEKIFRQRVEAALCKEADRLNEAGNPVPLQVWQAHLRYLTDNARQREDELAANLCYEMAFHLRMIGIYEKAYLYLKYALAIRKKVLGENHPKTLESMNNLGYLLKAKGEYKKARIYYEHALTIRKKVLGKEHTETANSLNNLGTLFVAMGAYEKALPYLESALAIWDKVLGEEHPDTASSINNLGGLFYMMGEFEKARPYFERTLVIDKKVLGEKHPDTALSFNNLGALLKAMGEYEEARLYYERALAIWEKVFGEEHPDTALSFNNLGLLFHAMGEYDQAMPYLERALAIRKKGPPT